MFPLNRNRRLRNKESLRNLKLLPERLEAYKNAYVANKQSQ